MEKQIKWFYQIDSFEQQLNRFTKRLMIIVDWLPPFINYKLKL